MRLNKLSGLAVAVALVSSCVGVPEPAPHRGMLAQLGCSPNFSDQPFYDPMAVRQRQSGVVLVELSVNAEGRPERLVVLEATAPEVLQFAALRVAENFKCEPGKDWVKAGGPERRVRLNVVFKLKKKEVQNPIDEGAEVVTVRARVDRRAY